MLTLFSCPKAFTGDSERLQRNAIGSWKRLPGCEIILFGNDAGTKEFADEVGAVHIPAVATSKYSTPLISDIFAQAQQRARFEWLCYINSDIVLLDDFIEGLRFTQKLPHPTVAIGECTDVKMPRMIDFTDSNWQIQIIREARKVGRSRGKYAMDFFIFRRGLFNNVPRFAIGRRWFDNWLVWEARRADANVLDLSPDILVIHQNHDYSHIGGSASALSIPSPEILENLRTAGGHWHLHSFHEATHRLENGAIRRSWPGTWRLHFYLIRPWRLLAYALLDLTRPVRQKFGLRRESSRQRCP